MPDKPASTVATNGFTKTGYTFAGWNTEPDGSGYTISSGGTLEKDYATDTTTVYDGATITLYAQWSPASGRWLVGDFDGCSWGIAGAVFMPYVTSQYVATITLAFGDKFKSAYYDGSSTLSSYYGWSYILSSCGAYKYFTNDASDNIVCYARSTYTVYFTDGDYGGGKKITIELSSTVNAEHLAAKLMNFSESPGHCGDNDRFPAMRTIYLGLSSDEKTIFQGYASSSTSQFKNAYDRYTAWARALGENPWANSKAAVDGFSPFNRMSGDDDNNITTIIIISASSVALLSITALSVLVVKKRKIKEE